MPNLIIGSRGSRLALWQSNWVKDQLEETYSGLVINIEIIKTTGDKLTEASLAQIGGKGVFTKEIEEALLDYRIDLAVHSLKDLPTTLPQGLHIAAITEREDVRDALIVREALRASVKSIEDLPEGARIGTSSLRRGSQIKNMRPDVRIIELRGNVETRLRKLDEGDYDAIILASAGLNRLGFDYRVTAYLSTTEMLPAVGQGALGIEARVDDHRANLLLEVLNHQPTRYAAEAERAVLRSLGGGCAVPIAAFAHIKKNRISQKLIVDALVADVDGSRLIRHQIGGPIQQAEELGAKLAEMLVESGARDLLPRLGAQTPLEIQATNGNSDVDVLADSFSEAPILAPPDDLSSNYSAESYASITAPYEDGTTNYSVESYAQISSPADVAPEYYVESLAPIDSTPEYVISNEPESITPLEITIEEIHSSENSVLEIGEDAYVHAPATAESENIDPGYLVTFPESGNPYEIPATEEWTPNHLVAPSDDEAQVIPSYMDLNVESPAQDFVAAPEIEIPLEPAEAEIGVLSDLSPASENGVVNELSPSPEIEVPIAQLTTPEPEPAYSVSVAPSMLENEVKVSAPKAAESGERRLPLSGRRVIVTRAVKQSGEMTRALESVGAEVIMCPTIEIKEPSDWTQLDWALIHLSWYDWLAFTSSNGVEYFLRRLDALGHGRAELMSHRVCAVGSKTAEKLKSENISVDLMPERFTAEAVVEEFIKRFGVRQRLRGSRMLLPASRTTRDVIRPALEKIGVYVEVVEAYQTVAPATNGVAVAKLFRDAEADYIIFTSPSTVSNLAAILETDHLTHQLANTRVACIGPVTAEAARLHGLTVHIQPDEHTGRAIVAAIVTDNFERYPAAVS